MLLEIENPSAGGADGLTKGVLAANLDIPKNIEAATKKQAFRDHPVVAINVRLKQMRELAKLRSRIGIPLDSVNWLSIYAEGLARRYGGNPLIQEAKRAKVPCTDDDLDHAIEYAMRSYQEDPSRSAYSSKMIGRMLNVTRKERTEFAYHLGCVEETADESKARLKAAKVARRAGARPRHGVQPAQSERAKPWEAIGIDRATYYRRKARVKSKAIAAGSCDCFDPYKERRRKSMWRQSSRTCSEAVAETFKEASRGRGLSRR